MKANKNIGTGNLFPNTAKSIFMRISGQRYDNMLDRVTRKGFFGLPFTKNQLRASLLHVMGGAYDGFFRCRYCTGFFTLADISIDHAIPLNRGGGVELENLEFPCKQCNYRKGELTPEEYERLLEFLDREIPLGKQDVLHRLEISVQLAAGGAWRAKKEREVT